LTRIAVLGTGMAGCGAIHRLEAEGVETTVYDKNRHPGGHTASFQFAGGFLFDDGPHISFTRVPRLQELFAENVGGEFERLQARVNNHWKGHWIKHPAQCNLYGLPTELVVSILRDFVEAQRAEPGEIHDYEQWLVATYGRSFAETFPMQYGEKYHTAPAREMTTDWLGPRLYRPELEEVLRGALSPTTPDVHYVDYFRYPTRGGFQAYLAPLWKHAEILLDHEVVGVDPVGRELRFAGGRAAGYDHLISSVPLPELVARIDGAPREVREAAQRLACTTCVLVNLGVGREEISEAQWTYIYDRDFTITRLSFPHLFSPHNAPPGAGSIQAEVYYSAKYRPLDRQPEELIEPVEQDLRRCGLLRPDDEILFENAWKVPYANIIFDHDRAAALAVVHGYLDEIGIAWCGRYGEWGYQWTDESFISGENAAQKVLDRL
jgi:protoporphyrinogen oxidase